MILGNDGTLMILLFAGGADFRGVQMCNGESQRNGILLAKSAAGANFRENGYPLSVYSR